MPYHISDEMQDCAGWAVVKDSDSTIMGCHETEQEAQDQLTALNIAESERMSVVDADTVGVTTMETETRELPPSYRPSSSDDVPVMRPACGSCEYFCIAPDMETDGEPVPHCHKWNAPVAIDGYCDAYEANEEEDKPMMEEQPEMEEDSVRSVEWIAVPQDEKRTVVYSNMEARAEGENGNTLVGYAAMFDMPSVDMGFTEYVSRGAFTKTLKDGADVRLLLDHVGAPLARTRSGTLRLSEDERGLRVEADLDPTNPLAQTVLSALRRGDMNQMSFAFRTIRDSWSKDGSVRELREVQLYDVSVVTFPAYESTVAEVRAQRNDTISVDSRARTRKAQAKIAIINMVK